MRISTYLLSVTNEQKKEGIMVKKTLLTVSFIIMCGCTLSGTSETQEGDENDETGSRNYSFNFDDAKAFIVTGASDVPVSFDGVSEEIDGVVVFKFTA